MRNRGVSRLEVLFIVLIILILGLILIPRFTIYHPPRSSITRDVYNLKSLVGIYISGQTEGKVTQKSVGHRFWLAMFVGDPVGVVGGLKIDDVYASPSQTGSLLSPEDNGIKTKDEITQAFENAISANLHGWDKLAGNDNLYTSYAGPRNIDVFSSKPNKIVGCTGSRNGESFFVDGFAVVYPDQKAEFLKYEDLAEQYPDEWTGEEMEPNWDSTLLKSVLNLDNAKTPARTQTQQK